MIYDYFGQAAQLTHIQRTQRGLSEPDVLGNLVLRPAIKEN